MIIIQKTVQETINNLTNWKISVYWVQHLRNLLAQPFDQRAIELLGCT
ncbi:hypothetical protein QUF63_15740 [Anaerolineales bacterium HSG25]|nr:hypothetical protein [Anaerolineales bacterium HSG25]